MSTLTPFNRHVLVRRQPKTEEETGILLPDDYKKSSNPYEVVTVEAASPNCAFIDRIPPGTRVVALSNFLEDINVDGTTHTVILENHIVGKL
jgi:co-chaperonin GroES (HSP10)